MREGSGVGSAFHQWVRSLGHCGTYYLEHLECGWRVGGGWVEGGCRVVVVMVGMFVKTRHKGLLFMTCRFTCKI